jgi:hypothetical protein
MNWEVASSLIVALLGLVGVWMQVRRGRAGSLGEIKQELEILAQLPESSTTRDRLLRHVEAKIDRMIEGETELRREPTGIAAGTFMIMLAMVLGYIAWTAEGWLRLLFILAFFIGIVGAYGLVQDVPRRKRDAKGRPIE